MKLNRVLVIYKGNLSDAPSPKRGGFASLAHSYKTARDVTIEKLTKLEIPHKLIDRKYLRPNPRADLIITIGGDGTLLSAAHIAGDIPLLGLNPRPGHSVGFFCPAMKNTIGSFLAKISKGQKKPKKLPLVEVEIDGLPLQHKALNDVLFAARSPAEMVRYQLRTDGKREAQRSSGIWFAAGPGSTAAIRSAGAKKLSVTSDKLQFLVREPYVMGEDRLKLTKGVIPKRQSISVISQIGDGRVYLDGPKIVHSVHRGSTVKVRVAKETVKIFL